MKRLLLPALLLGASCVNPTPPPSYWHLSIPVSETAPGDVDRLIRETVPLFNEVAEAWNRKRTTQADRQALLAKARKVERNLASALMSYLSLPPDEPGKAVTERRSTRLQELLTDIRAFIREIESSL